jgi:hypothetical protein
VRNRAPAIHVHMEGTASATEVESVYRLFEDANVNVEVKATYGIGGDIPQIAIWILVISPAITFLNEVSASTARKLVQTIWNSRTQDTGYQGILAIADSRYLPEANFSAQLKPNLPEDAYTDLRMLANKLGRGKVKYDSEIQRWVVDDAELRSQIERLDAERSALLQQLHKPRWKFWNR